MSPDRYRAITEHTCLKPDAKEKDLKALCREAAELKLGAVCINPLWAEFCVGERKQYPDYFKVVTVVDFPLGAGTTKMRRTAAEEMEIVGVDEIDVVIPIGKLLDGDSAYIFNDLLEVCHTGLYTKIILESSMIGEKYTIDGAILSLLAGADCLKTSTGINGKATEKDVRLLRAAAGDNADVKAAGGIRYIEDVVRMTVAGANRLGMSSSADIYKNK